MDYSVIRRSGKRKGFGERPVQKKFASIRSADADTVRAAPKIRFRLQRAQRRCRHKVCEQAARRPSRLQRIDLIFSGGLPPDRRPGKLRQRESFECSAVDGAHCRRHGPQACPPPQPHRTHQRSQARPLRRAHQRRSRILQPEMREEKPPLRTIRHRVHRPIRPRALPPASRKRMHECGVEWQQMTATGAAGRGKRPGTRSRRPAWRSSPAEVLSPKRSLAQQARARAGDGSRPQARTGRDNQQGCSSVAS